ncbi:MAG: hypothetical protein N2C14_10370, partial [Planctomycetales bacterium]
MAPSSLPHAKTVQPIRRKLRRLRGRIALWFLVDGFSRLAACLSLLIFLDFWADWTFMWDQAQRTMLLALASGVLAVVCYRRVARPFLTKLSDDALCLMVEKQFSRLGESLISALQFSRLQDEASQGVSPTMVQAAVRQGVEAAENLDFDQVLRSGRHKANLALLGISAALLLGAGASAADDKSLLNVWFHRNVLLNNREWPQDVYLAFPHVSDGQLRVPRGEDWPITVEVAENSTRVPQEILLEIRGRDGYRAEPMIRRGTSRRFETQLRAPAADFEFRAVAGRARTPWRTAKLVSRPVVAQLELQAVAPLYAGGQTEELPRGRGPYAVLLGGTVRIQG